MKKGDDVHGLNQTAEPRQVYTVACIVRYSGRGAKRIYVVRWYGCTSPAGIVKQLNNIFNVSLLAIGKAYQEKLPDEDGRDAITKTNDNKKEQVEVNSYDDLQSMFV